MKETGKVESCYGVIEAAEKGELQIITSALTIAEVLYLKGHRKIAADSAEKVCRFFENDYIIIVTLDRYIAETARNFIWIYNVRPKDSIHVATAIKAKVPILDTFDEGLIKLSKKIGNPPLIINRPNICYQQDIEILFKENENRKEENS